MRPVILVGGGGHCKSVIDVAENAGLTIKGILDVAENVGKKVFGYEILGTDDSISSYVSEADFIVTVGFIKDASLRIKIHERILSAEGRLATIIASTAYVSRYAFIEEGTVIMHQVVVNAGARIGKGCIINTFSNIEHDAIVGDYCHISTGVMINGGCKVGARTFVGSQSVMVNGISITEDCVLAAGSMVRKSLLKKGIYAGNPAILMKKQ